MKSDLNPANQFTGSASSVGVIICPPLVTLWLLAHKIQLSDGTKCSNLPAFCINNCILCEKRQEMSKHHFSKTVLAFYVKTGKHTTETKQAIYVLTLRSAKSPSY